VYAVERQRQRRRRPVRAVLTAVEETDSRGIDGGGGDRWSIERQSREWRGPREFWDKKQNDTGWATIYWFKNISNNS
jgi:hypothetical protein